VRFLTAVFVLLVGFSASVTSAAGQSRAAFGKSKLIRSDSQGDTLKVKGVLRVGPERVWFEGKKETQPSFEASYDDITNLVYERTKKPRYSAGLLLAWPLLFTKEKEHYLTIEANGAFAFIKLHKSKYRAAIAAIQSASGIEVERLAE